MLTHSELDAIRMKAWNGTEEMLCSIREDYSIWIGRLIHTEADARLLLPPIEVNLMDYELVEFNDGTTSTRLERIDFLLQYWDDPSEIDRLEEAGDLLEYLIEAEKDDDHSWECYQLAHVGLGALSYAVGERIREHQTASQVLPVSSRTDEPVSQINSESLGPTS